MGQFLVKYLPEILMTAGTTTAAAGEIGQAGISASELKSAQAVAEYNALLSKREAQAIEQKTAFERQRHAEKTERAMSTLEAEMAAATGVISAGAPVMVLAKQRSELELENLLIGYEGALEARRARSQAALDIEQGQIYRRRASAAKAGGYLRAGTTLLTGFSKVFENVVK